MRIRFCDVLLAAAILAIVAPTWGRTDTATLSFQKPVHVGSAMLDSGNYQIRADESSKQLEIEKDGKIVAQVPCHWIQLDSKSPADEVIVSKDTVQQIRFEGRTAAAQID
jgi:hypothetical protein